jgi:hypothetical protein
MYEDFSLSSAMISCSLRTNFRQDSVFAACTPWATVK